MKSERNKSDMEAKRIKEERRERSESEKNLNL